MDNNTSTDSSFITPENSVTFTDIAPDLNSGVTYERFESPERLETLDQIEALPTFSAENLGDAPLFPEGSPGIAVLDFDNDGDEDLYVTNGPGVANSLYANQLTETGEVTFVDVAESAGVAAIEQDSSGVSSGDIDNDGDSDLLVLGAGDENKLFENQGDGIFVDITETSGIAAGIDRWSSSASMGDVNGDGLLDIVVANTFDWNSLEAIVFEPYALNEHNQLFINNGDNTFTNVSSESGIENLGGLSEGAPDDASSITWAISTVDYDGDGDLDIIHADDQGAVAPEGPLDGIDRGVIQVLQNDGTGNFTNVTEEVGLDIAGGWMGLSFADFNGDGNLDLFASNFGQYARGFTQTYEGNSRWFLGQDDGTFIDPGVGDLGATPFGWGNAATDYDNDGDTDIIFQGGIDEFLEIDASNPGAVLNNDGSANFTYDSNALANGADHTRRSDKGVAVGDLNNDGFVDLISVSNFNYPESIPLQPFAETFDSPFDEEAAFIPNFIPVDPSDPSNFELIPPGDRDFSNGTLAIEINNAENDNFSVHVDLLGTTGLVEGGQTNRDGIGAVVSFTPENGSTAIQPILGGSSFLSQNSLTANFGLGDNSSGTVEVVWSGGVRNRLYDVQESEEIIFPEIPVSFDGDYASLEEYETLVEDAIAELVAAGEISAENGSRFLTSAVRAYTETQGITDNLATPQFGTVESDLFEINSNNQIVFAGDNDDTIDTSIASGGNNRIYGGSGDDTIILGTDDRAIAGEDDDRIFVTSEGNNTLTGGAGADQFWIASAEIPQATNIITDFTFSEDVIGLAGLSIGFSDLTLTQQENDGLIQVGDR